MKSKIFNKLIAGAAILAMAAQFAFVLPASADEATVIYERGTETAWSDADLTEWTNVTGSTYVTSSIENGLKLTGQNEDVTFRKSLSTADNAVLSIEAEWDTGSSTGRAGGYNYLKIGDVEFRAYGQDAKGTVSIGETETQITTAKDDVRSGVWTVSATVNTASKEITYTVKLPSNNADVTGSGIAQSTDFGAFDIGYHKPGRITGTNQKLNKIKISQTVDESVYYLVQYNVDGVKTTDSVKSGGKSTQIPTNTDKIGYIFKGWKKDTDEENLLTSDQIKDLSITADTIFTAVYEKDASYIEPMTAVEFDAFPTNNLLVAGADADTAASNPISVKITGELGTNLLTTPDARVTDLNVKYEIKGFRWVASKNEATTDKTDSNGYCDSYGELVVNDEAKTADFKIKNHPFNYYGQITATVTYNGVTKTISRPLAYIGNSAKASVNDILPRGGYISDFNKYAPDMVGYEAAISANNSGASDVTSDNWAAYGGNTKTLKIAEENGKKFLKLNALGTDGSCFAANQIEAVTDGQLIFDQMIRFKNPGSAILLKTANPVTWNDNATSVTISFTNTGFSINNGEVFAPATTNVWYRVVISSDVTSKKYFAKVYSEDNQLIGESEISDFVNAGSTNPTYYAYRLPDRAVGELDFNDVKIYRATIDQSTMAATATATTLAIPEEGEAATTAELAVSAKTTEGYDAIGAATWSVADDAEGITVTPSANDSHTATVSVASSASAGTATINVMIGGIQKSIDLTITSSQDSIAFNTPVVNSVSIPMDDKNTVVNYAARVIDKDGAAIAGKTVTFDLYDKNNTNPATVEGVTFANGVLTVTKNAKPCVVTVRATSTNSNGETITNAVKVTIHGLAFDFGAGTDEDVVSGYTPITPTTAYTAKAGYGIEGSPTVGGTASLDDADTDNLAGTFTFKANVTPNKVYKVKVNYQGTAAFENISADLSGVVRTNAAKNTQEYLAYVHDDGVLDITFSNYTYKENDQNKTVEPQVSSIVIEKTDDKTIPAGGKPNVYTVGDSTIANNGSWAYVLNRDQANYPELTALATFSNNGRGGKNLSSYYTGGELWDRVVTNVRAGDYVMIGDMGTNGMGTDFKGSFTYYVDACLARGAKVILNSYSPHMYVGAYANCYDSTTHTFNGWRQDSYDNIVREIYEERKDEFAGFVEIGKNADASFTAYAADYAKNGYDSTEAAAQAIIACAGSTPGNPDHNHYSNGTIAAKLMIEGYGSTKGIVAQLVDILSAVEEPPTPIEYTVTFKNGDTVMKTVTVESGSKVAAADIPDIPAKEGFTGKWMVGDDEFTVDTVITGNTIVTLDYTKNASDDFDIIFRWAEETDGGVLITTAVTGTGEDKFNAYVAEYDADTHALIGVAQKLIVISDAESDAKIDYVRQKDNSTLKAFVWERGNMKPRLNLTGVILPSNPIDD